jgi:hypothetical protein
MVAALASLLSACVIGAENARHDMETSKQVYKTCLAERGSEACERERQSYEADLAAHRATPKLVIGAGNSPPNDFVPAGTGAALDSPDNGRTASVQSARVHRFCSNGSLPRINSARLQRTTSDLLRSYAQWHLYRSDVLRQRHGRFQGNAQPNNAVYK